MGRSPVGNLILDIDGTLIDSVPDGHTRNVPRSPDCISQWGDYIFFRPHLESFLLYAFSRFQHVSIWTAASPEWAETILLGLEPMLRRIKQQLNRSSPVECSCGARSRRSSSKADVDELTTLGDRLGRTTGHGANALYSSCSCVVDISGMFSFVFTKDRCTRKAVEDETNHHLYEYHTKPLRKIWRRSSFRNVGWTAANTLILEDTPQNCIDNYGNALYIRTYNIMEVRSDSALLILQAFLDRIRNVGDVRSIEKRNWERLCASAATRPAPLRRATSAPSGINIPFISSQSQQESEVSSGSRQFFRDPSLTSSSSNSSFSSSSTTSSSQLGRTSHFQQFTAPYAHNWPFSGVTATGSSSKIQQQTAGSSSLTSSSSNFSSQQRQQSAQLSRLIEEVEEITIHVGGPKSAGGFSSTASSSSLSSSSNGRPAILKHSATSDSIRTHSSQSSAMRSGTFHGMSSQSAIDEATEEYDSDLEDSYQRWGSRIQEEEEDDHNELAIDNDADDDYTDEEESEGEYDDEKEEGDHSSSTGSDRLLYRSPSYRRHAFDAATSTFDSYESEASSDEYDSYHEEEGDDEAASLAGDSQVTHTTSEGEEDRRYKLNMSTSSAHSKRSKTIVEERLDAHDLLLQRQQTKLVQSLSSAGSKSRESSSFEHEDSDGEEQDFDDADSDISYDDSEELRDDVEQSFRKSRQPKSEDVFLSRSEVSAASVGKMSSIPESSVYHNPNGHAIATPRQSKPSHTKSRKTVKRSESEDMTTAVSGLQGTPRTSDERQRFTSAPQMPESGSACSASPFSSSELALPHNTSADEVPLHGRSTGKTDASEEIYV